MAAMERSSRVRIGMQKSKGLAKKGTILVVDDNRLVLATLSDGLAQAGYDVIDADNGDDAILLAREHKPDLALLDIRMEGKSGFDVAQYLRTQCRMPFMFLSAFSDEETVAQVEALGAVAYLVKPLDIRQIVPAVEAAFANLEATRAAASSEPVPLRRVAASNDPLDTSVALAAGVLMHRHSLKRGEALERLRRSAAAAGHGLHDAAELLLAAVEQLASS
jgi:response regulator NasT